MPADFQQLSRLLSLDANNRAIINIGVAGTDFGADGSLALAAGLDLTGNIRLTGATRSLGGNGNSIIINTNVGDGSGTNGVSITIRARRSNLGTGIQLETLNAGGGPVGRMSIDSTIDEAAITWANSAHTGFKLLAGSGLTTADIAGIANSAPFNMPIIAGGAANAVIQWPFQLDSVTEAGLLGETDGAGTYTQAKTIWKIPYRDSGAAVAAPTVPTTAATWLGGIRIEAGDDTNRIYFFANEAYHYINQTAGFEIPAPEKSCPKCQNQIEVGQRVVGRIDRILGDEARHGLWEHENCSS